LFGSLVPVGGERGTGPSQILSRDAEDLLSSIERGESLHGRIWPFSRDYDPRGIKLSECRTQIGNSAADCVVKRYLLFGCRLQLVPRFYSFGSELMPNAWDLCVPKTLSDLMT
jgi:hypothetical protein